LILATRERAREQFEAHAEQGQRDREDENERALVVVG
jgi:hypothetical protein